MGTVLYQSLASQYNTLPNMPIVKFVYFDLQGKGEVTRLLLNAGNIDFEDFRFSFDDWAEIKPTTPFGQVPVLHWDGEEIAQSMAIARFVARKVGMAGRSDLEFVQADMIACHTEDVWSKLPGLRFSKTQEDRETNANAFLKEFLPVWLKPLETVLEKRGGDWFAGSAATFAELSVMVLLDFLHEPEEMAFKEMDNLDERCKVLDDFPLVKANYERTCALPSVADWKKKRPEFNGF